MPWAWRDLRILDVHDTFGALSAKLAIVHAVCVYGKVMQEGSKQQDFGPFFCLDG